MHSNERDARLSNAQLPGLRLPGGLSRRVFSGGRTVLDVGENPKGVRSPGICGLVFLVFEFANLEDMHFSPSRLAKERPSLLKLTVPCGARVPKYLAPPLNSFLTTSDTLPIIPLRLSHPLSFRRPTAPFPQLRVPALTHAPFLNPHNCLSHFDLSAFPRISFGFPGLLTQLWRNLRVRSPVRPGRQEARRELY